MSQKETEALQPRFFFIFLFLFLKHMQHSSVTHLPIFAFQAFRVQNDTICQWTVPTHVSPYDKEIHPLHPGKEIHATDPVDTHKVTGPHPTTGLFLQKH